MTKDWGLIGLGLMIAVWGGSPVRAADAPAASPAAADVQSPQVPPAAPGVFTAQKRGAAGFHLAVTGHTFTSRDAIEKYLAYRAAELAKAEHGDWFSLVEKRAKGDTAPVPKTDRAGPRFSFRMEYWRPLWRYKADASPAWKSWSPFSGSAFFAGDPKTVTAYEVSADIVLHKGMMTGTNPLAFDADALSDFLVNQVSPSQ
jgi:hypothetical protein